MKKRTDLATMNVVDLNSTFETCNTCAKKLTSIDKCMFYQNEYKEQLEANTGALVYCSKLCLDYGTLKLDTKKLLIAIECNTYHGFVEGSSFRDGEPIINQMDISEEINNLRGIL